MSNYRIVLLETQHGESAVASLLAGPLDCCPELAELEAMASLHPGRLLAVEQSCSTVRDWVRFRWIEGMDKR